MRRLLLSTGFIFLGLSSSLAQQLLIEEDGGGSATSGWTFNNNVVSNGIDQTTSWLLEAGSPGDEIITATYDLSDFSSAFLSVTFSGFGSGSNNALKVDISYDGGSTFTESVTADTTMGSSQIDLEDYEPGSFSSQVVLKFSNSGTSGRGVSIVEIGFEGTKKEPTNHPTSFAASVNSFSSITLSWTDATGDVLPDRYLIKASNVSLAAITDPTDGSLATIDSDLSDGSAVDTVSQGDQTYTFSNLKGSTEYFFKIYSFTNPLYSYDYKTSGTIQTTSATTSAFSSDLVISQYINTTSGDNADIRQGIELWNVSGSTIDFSTSNLVIRRYLDGSSTPLTVSTINTGTLADDELFIVGYHSDFTDYMTTYFPSVSFVFDSLQVNGDDAIDITLGGTLQDVFGTIGSDPGTEWSGNGVSTRNQNIELQFAITSGTDVGFSDPSTRFQSLVGSIGANADSSALKGFGARPGEVIILGNEGWRLLSIPKTGGKVSDISDDTAVQGITGGANADSTTNFVIYDSDGVFEEPTNVSTAWGDGYGFALYFYDNTSAGSSELPVILDTTEPEPFLNVTVTLNSGAANQFTLVGNPFFRNYNTGSITATGGSISDNLSVWSDVSSSYSSVDRTNSSQQVSAMWQGFWVETADASVTSITFPKSGKTTSTVGMNSFSKQVANRGDISFTLTSEDSHDENLRIALRDYATIGNDRADGTKLNPLLTEYAIMSFNNGERLKSVESLPWNLEEEVTLALEHTLVGVSGEFTFAWNGLETIPGDWQLTLHDYELVTSINMREVGEYQFMAQADVQAKANPLSILTGPTAVTAKAKATLHRFGITIGPTSVSNELDENPQSFSLSQNYPNPFNPATTINYSLQEAGAVTISIYNVMGQKVATLVDEQKSAGQHAVRWEATGVSSGMYYYRLEANGQTITRKMTLIK